MIPSQRHLFDIPEDVAFLDCAYLGPIPKAAVQAGIERAWRKAHPWVITPDVFFSEVDEVRDLYARIFDADPDGMAMTSSASYGMATAAKNVKLTEGGEIVILQDEFPSTVYTWRDACARTGARIVTVRRAPDQTWTDAVLAAIGPRTEVLAIPETHWVDGGLLDLVRIGEAARDSGAALVLDLTQSLGASHFDAAAVQPDFACAATYKWLLGPYTVGVLYVAPKWRDGSPLEHSWLNRAASEDFARLIDYRDDYQAGARRFDMGERSNFHTLPIAISVMRQILEWGVGDIADTCGVLTRRCEEAAVAAGAQPCDTPDRAPHYLTLGLPDGVGDDLVARLRTERVYVSRRGPRLRVTPHLWVNDADIERFHSALARALRS